MYPITAYGVIECDSPAQDPSYQPEWSSTKKKSNSRFGRLSTISVFE